MQLVLLKMIAAEVFALPLDVGGVEMISPFVPSALWAETFVFAAFFDRAFVVFVGRALFVFFLSLILSLELPLI